MLPRGRPRAYALAVGAAAAVALSGACARQGAPPGGPEDRRPPVVVRTEPDTYAVVTDFRGPVRFVFDERISERLDGTLEDAVLVSPQTGEPRVTRGRQSIEVELDGGFEEGRVYRVTLLPVVRDLFNNQLADPFELVFSTGAEVLPNAVAGLVWDRITGQGVENAWIHARPTEGDSTTLYVARTDEDGVYGLRFLPEGRFAIQAFFDVNRNGELDETEQRGVANFPVGPTDTVIANVSLLAPDTSAAIVTRVDVVDSVTLLVVLDDYLAPTMPLTTVGVGLTPAVDTTAPPPPDSVELTVPGVERIFHEHEYVEWLEEVSDSFARLDSLEAAARAEDTAAAAVDTAGPAGDTLSAAEQGPAAEAAASAQRPVRRLPAPLPAASGRGRGGAGATTPDGGPLPSRRIVVRLDGYLAPNRAFQVSVTGVRNINGLPLGGGDAVVAWSPPPPVDDTASPPDTGGMVLPRDTPRERPHMEASLRRMLERRR